MTLTFYLTGQNNFGNRGCEALTRSAVMTLRAEFDRIKVLVPSFDPQRDQRQWPDHAVHGVEFVASPEMPRLFAKWMGACQRLPPLQRLPLIAPTLPPVLVADLQRSDVLLSIGGDNYSLDYGLASLLFFAEIAELALRLGKPTMLWGASVGPFSRAPRVEQHMARHLDRLTLIGVRESRSIDYLKSIGVSRNVVPVVDSAFALTPEPVDTEAWWPTDPGDGVIGLNIGWLVDDLRRRAGHADGLTTDVVGFVRDVVARTRFAVVLIPHVAPLDGNAFNNDEIYHAQLLRALGGPNSRVASVPPGFNAAQLKTTISMCRFLIGARTHATIAAFSSAVPTLSIAYSVKAMGINRDLFGHERYVLETPKVSRETLWRGLELLRCEEAQIRERYQTHRHAWDALAHAGARRLSQLLLPRTEPRVCGERRAC